MFVFDGIEGIERVERYIRTLLVEWDQVYNVKNGDLGIRSSITVWEMALAFCYE